MKKINFSLGVKENTGTPEVEFLISLLSDYFIAESGIAALIRVIDSLQQIQLDDPITDKRSDSMLDYRNTLSKEIEAYSRYQKLLQTEIADEIEHPKDISMSTRIRNLLGVI